ncbi:MAG: 3'(2'),5'-bisphosphate nucleotidase CysQ family protein [Pyrinomonadaceae bacterium]
MLEKELETAIELARKASVLILDFYENGFEIEEKIGIDNFAEPVTIADKLASKLIVEGLHETFPDDAILSEEESDDTEKRLSKKRAWIIDPIDGTQSFVDKAGDFAVQIGLTENGESVLGVVLLPFYNCLYFASKDAGAFAVEKNESPKRLRVSDKTDFPAMNLAVSRNHLSPKMSHIAKDLGIGKITKRGSVGLKVGLIAEKICDLYIHLSPRTKFWDTCAPQIILEEAGGKLTDIFGGKIRYNLRDVQNHNGIAASNGAAHEKVITSLKPLLGKFGRLRVKAKSRP